MTIRFLVPVSVVCKKLSSVCPLCELHPVTPCWVSCIVNTRLRSQGEAMAWPFAVIIGVTKDLQQVGNNSDWLPYCQTHITGLKLPMSLSCFGVGVWLTNNHLDHVSSFFLALV